MEAEADLCKPDLCSEFHPGQQPWLHSENFSRKIKKKNILLIKPGVWGRWGHSIHVTQEQLLEVTSFCHGCPGNLTPVRLTGQASLPDEPS